jgi:hypothetical protein
MRPERGDWFGVEDGIGQRVVRCVSRKVPWRGHTQHTLLLYGANPPEV